MFQKETPRDDDSYPLYADTNTSLPFNYRIDLTQSSCLNLDIHLYVLSSLHILTVLSSEQEAKRPSERGSTSHTLSV